MSITEANILIIEIYDSELELSDWEQDFVDDIAGQIDEGKDLSKKQDKKLKQIYEKVQNFKKEIA